MSVTIITPDACTEEWRGLAASASQVIAISDTNALLHNPNDGPFRRFVALQEWLRGAIGDQNWSQRWLLARPSYDSLEGRQRLLNIQSLRSRLWALRDWRPDVFSWTEAHSSVSFSDDEALFAPCKGAVITIFDGDPLRMLRLRSMPYGYVERTDDFEFPLETLPEALSDSMSISAFIEAF